MMGTDVLTVVQKLQFTDLPAANSLLKEFFANNLPLKVRSVDLRPLPVSLNSITGIVLTMDDEKFFFKAHIEPSSADLEYYNADLLERAGYPTLKPIFRTPGTLTEHILLYEVVQLPTLFEVMRSADRGEHHAPAQILTIHEKLDDHLWQIYRNTLRTAGSMASLILAPCVTSLTRLFAFSIRRLSMDPPLLAMVTPTTAIFSLTRVHLRSSTSIRLSPASIHRFST